VIMAEEIFDISENAFKRAEDSFWRGIRIRYWKRNQTKMQENNDDNYDIEMLLNTVQILKSEIDQLEKRIKSIEVKNDSTEK